MSRWTETFAALSRGVDTVDTSAADGATVSRSVHSVSAPTEASERRSNVRLRLIWVEADWPRSPVRSGGFSPRVRIAYPVTPRLWRAA
jgi:hypothetical protein